MTILPYPQTGPRLSSRARADVEVLPRPGAASDGDAQTRRAVLFDFGDTLVHFGRINRRRLFLRAALRTYQLWEKRQVRMPGWQRYYLHQWFALHWALFKTAVLRREMDAVRYIRRACRKLWLTAPRPFYNELTWQWYEPLARAATLDPDARRVLDRLQADGYELALVSNTFLPPFVMDRHLEQLGLRDYFPVRVYSSETGYRKPHPRIFEIALERLDLDAGAVVFVGDRVDCDVRGPRRIGMRALHLAGRDADPNDCEHPAVQRLTDLPAALADALPWR